MNYKSFIIFFLIITIFSNLNAQEIIFPVNTKNKINKNKQKKAENLLELPFFDDFTHHDKGIADPEKWTGNNVFINNNLAYYPPSFGVATFDAVKNSGEFYSGADYNTEFYADTLTSLPINLYYPDNETIFLSFYYQPQGISDKPETEDSLFLDFYSPLNDEWINIWKKEGSMNQSFKQHIIQVSGNEYLQEGFQFRFRNKASLGTGSVPDIVANCDFWHIDYIKLDKNRNESDTINHDIAFQYPVNFLFNNYQLLPNEHAKKAIENNELTLSYEITYRNNDNKIRLLDSLSLYIQADNKNKEKIYIGSYNFHGYTTVENNNDNLSYTFPIPEGNETDYALSIKLVTDEYDVKSNNLSTITKKFSNEYAIDDGTAEAGYGIGGEGTQQAMVACKFYTHKTDYLKGVNISFNPVFANRQAQYFYLMVWNQNSETGLPGELIYEKEGLQVNKSNFNEFNFYEFDSLFTVTDTFFIGWRKTVTEILNVGIDISTKNINNKFYNINGYWSNSQIQGQLLFRPVFGKNNTTEITEQSTNNEHLKVYPNPVNDILTLEFESDSRIFQKQIYIFNGIGKLVDKYIIDGENYNIDVKKYPEGIYYIRCPEMNVNRKFLKIN